MTLLPLGSALLDGSEHFYDHLHQQFYLYQHELAAAPTSADNGTGVLVKLEAAVAATGARCLAEIMPTNGKLKSVQALPRLSGKLASRASVPKREPVPLMIDPTTAEYTSNSPFRSVVGAGLALPGHELSTVGTRA